MNDHDHPPWTAACSCGYTAPATYHWLCPAPIGDDGRPHMADLPCAEHGVADRDMGHALYGNIWGRRIDSGQQEATPQPEG